MQLENITGTFKELGRNIKEFARDQRDFLIASEVFIPLKVADGISTYLCFSNGGLDYELNPLLRYSAKMFGVNSGFAIASLAPLLFLGAADYLNKNVRKNLGNDLIWFISGLTLAATLCNFYNYYKSYEFLTR